MNMAECGRTNMSCSIGDELCRWSSVRRLPVKVAQSSERMQMGTGGGDEPGFKAVDTIPWSPYRFASSRENTALPCLR